MTLQSTTLVGRYEIHEAIGEGGFGTVYRAWDPEFERWVAIKELTKAQHEQHTGRYHEHQERFQLERRVQGRFQHPHIVSVYDLVQQGDNEYLVEEYVPGGTLRDYLAENGPLSPEQTVRIGQQLCHAIAAAWERDVVHRDIKPSNILLTEEGNIKLSDFGIAQVGLMSQRTQSSTQHPGTPAYKSPEQEKEHGYLDERSDLYTLGLVLYEALTGKLYKRERVPPRHLRPDFPVDLEKVILRAIATNPDERYQHATDFAAALQKTQQRKNWLWILWLGSLLLITGLAFMGKVIFDARQPLATPSPTVTPVAASIPTATATSIPPTPTNRASPTPRPSTTPSSTPTSTPRTTAQLEIAPLALLNPSGGALLKSARLTLRWRGTRPDETYAYQAHLFHNSVHHTSPLLTTTQWTLDLPGDDTWGEWRWYITLIQQDDPNTALTQSDTWTFYYNPFSDNRSDTPSVSPLSTPISPLATPTP